MANDTVVMQRSEPVTGSPGNFRLLEDRFGNVKKNVDTIDGELDAIRFGTDDAAFKGQAADAFKGRIAAVDNYLADFGDIALQIAGIFSDHATRLEQLQSEADAAAARARIQWNKKINAENDEAEQGRASSLLQQQIDEVAAAGPGTEQTVIDLERRLDDAEIDRSASARQARNAGAALEAERACWDEIAGKARDLAEETAARLHKVELDSLANPGLLDQIGDGIADFAGWLADMPGEVAALVAALGEVLLDGLEAIYEFLEKISELLVTIMVILVVIAIIIIAVVGTGGAALAAIAIALKALSIASAAVKVWQAGTAGLLVAGGRMEKDEFLADLKEAAIEVAVLAVTMGGGKLVGKVLPRGADKITKVGHKWHEFNRRSGGLPEFYTEEIVKSWIERSTPGSHPIHPSDVSDPWRPSGVREMERRNWTPILVPVEIDR